MFIYYGRPRIASQIQLVQFFFFIRVTSGRIGYDPSVPTHRRVYYASAAPDLLGLPRSLNIK